MNLDQRKSNGQQDVIIGLLVSGTSRLVLGCILIGLVDMVVMICIVW